MINESRRVLAGRGHVGDTNVDGKTILKWSLEE
jgi:hypothetical protein